MGACDCFNKFVLVVLNFIVFVFGIGVVVLGSVVIHKGQEYKDMLLDGIFSLPVIILIIGLLITLLGFFGCCGALRENPCMLYTYAAVLLILFVSGIVLGVLILIYPNKAEETLKKPFSKAFYKYGGEDTALNKVIEAFQHDFQCCGVNNYTDWLNPNEPEYRDALKFCCKSRPGCNENNPDDLFKQGCYSALYDSLKDAAKILGITCVVLSVVEFFCICIACGLARKRSEYV